MISYGNWITVTYVQENYVYSVVVEWYVIYDICYIYHIEAIYKIIYL